jgi:hypothetical protein
MGLNSSLLNLLFKKDNTDKKEGCISLPPISKIEIDIKIHPSIDKM